MCKILMARAGATAIAMPSSNQNREGFEKKLAQVIDTALRTGAKYCWRPSIERGLMRITLSEADCDEGHSGIVQ